MSQSQQRFDAIVIAGGLMTLERAKVIMYRPHKPEDEEADDWGLDVTGSWQSRP